MDEEVPPLSRAKAAVITLALALPVIVAGLAVTLATGQWRWAIIGGSIAAALDAGFLYYRLTLDGKFLSDAIARTCAFAIPIITGAVLDATTGDWRWLVTGLLVGAALPGLAQAGWEVVSYETGWVMTPIFFGVGSVLAGLLYWLWSANSLYLLIPVGALAFGIVMVISMLFVKLDDV